MMKKLLVVFMALLMVCGCANKENKDNVSTITGKEKITIAFGGNSAPFSFVKEVQGDYSVYCNSDQFLEGYDVRVARYIASSLNKEIEAKKMNQQQGLEALKNGEIDLYFNALTTKDTLGVANSEVYYEEGFSVVVLKDSKCAKYKEISKFAKKKVTSLKDSLAYECIAQIENVKAHEGYATYTEAMNALIAKDVDAIVAPTSVAKKLAANDKTLKVLTFKEGKGFDQTIQYVIAINPEVALEEEGLAQEVNKLIKQLDAETAAEWMKQALK